MMKSVMERYNFAIGLGLSHTLCLKFSYSCLIVWLEILQKQFVLVIAQLDDWTWDDPLFKKARQRGPLRNLPSSTGPIGN